MKKISIAFLIALWFICPLTLAANNVLENINATVKQIDQRQKTYQSKTKAVVGLSSEGAEIKYYYQQKNLIKISAHFVDKMGFAQEDLYFNNNLLIFITTTTDHTDKPFGKLTSKEENNYYFSDGKMIEWINEKGIQVKPTTSLFISKALELKTTADEYVEISRSKYQCVDVAGETATACKQKTPAVQGKMSSTD